jgi:hypothetical protein
MKRLTIIAATLDPEDGTARRTINYAVTDSENRYDVVEKALTREFPLWKVTSMRLVTQARLISE